jgi:uncharacterized surface protein with fasciclin (FAS1) repeats
LKKIYYMSIQNWKFNTTDSGTFFWQAIAKGGEVLGQSSQNFKSRNGASYNADLLGRNGKFSPKLMWDFTQNKENKWIWKADNTVNKENVAASHTPFESQVQAVQNAILFGYKGALTSLVNKPKSQNANTSQNSAKAGVAAGFVGGSKENTTKETPKVSTNSTNGYNSNYINEPLEIGWLGWLKWLILALLILALLWWLLPQLLRRFNFNGSNNPVSTLNGSLPAGLSGALQKPEFDLLKDNLKTANLLDDVNQSTPITLLAPINAAFQALPADTLANLQKPENLPQFQNLLKNHLFAGNLDLNSLKDGTTIKSLAGVDLSVKVEGSKLFIDGVEVEKTSDSNANGFTVYSVPNILNIPTPADPSVPALVTPLPAPAVITPPATVVTPNPTTPPATTTISSISYKAGGNLDFLNKDGGFTTLLTAINASGLKDTLEGTGPITLYAPSDEAFKPLQSTVTELLKPENKTKLQDFLKSHVVLGKNTFGDFVATTEVKNLNNQTLTLNTNAAGGFGQVVGPKGYSLAPVEDIFTNNGVIQVLTDSPILN